MENTFKERLKKMSQKPENKNNRKIVKRTGITLLQSLLAIGALTGCTNSTESINWNVNEAESLVEKTVDKSKSVKDTFEDLIEDYDEQIENAEEAYEFVESGQWILTEEEKYQIDVASINAEFDKKKAKYEKALLDARTDINNDKDLSADKRREKIKEKEEEAKSNIAEAEKNRDEKLATAKKEIDDARANEQNILQNIENSKNKLEEIQSSLKDTYQGLLTNYTQIGEATNNKSISKTDEALGYFQEIDEAVK